ICESLHRLGHKVYAIDPATGKSLLTSDGTFVLGESTDNGATAPKKKPSTSLLTSTIGSPAFHDIEIVFIALHGGSGENGKIQCLLDLAGRGYTGSGMTASAIAMNKDTSKRLCQSEGIDTPDWVMYRTLGTVDERLFQEICSRFKMPVIVKPNDGGSTIGLSLAKSEAELHDAIDRALKESSDLMVEKFVKGREITVSVLDGRPLALVEIKSSNELYDFEAKYTKGKSEYISPAEVSEALTKKLQEAAVKIYNVIGASGLARVDFILDAKKKFHFLELNTLPGMTELSLAPMAAKADGIAFDELIGKLLKSAMNKQAS
ncbi:MAG: D-alanine--D-alanine ligase, partial [candidate division Zixibacteria bacterium]|nr:D-alanine--D-alanine ligase [candidate division Zixibacteria bacterium]